MACSPYVPREWDEFERQQFVLTSIFDGGEFLDTDLHGPTAKRRVQLPTQYSADAAYHVDVAAFGTSANIERRRDMALAVSLRFNK